MQEKEEKIIPLLRACKGYYLFDHKTKFIEKKNIKK
nr:MAG TPA: hypothetical protein [Caudoviricetes sp.]